MTRVTWLTVCACAWLVVGISGCSRPPLGRDGGAGTGTAGGEGAGTGGATGAASRDRRRRAGTGGGSAGTGGGGPAGGDSGVMSSPASSARPQAAAYCNTIGNGCPGGKLECRPCPASDICIDGVCVGGASCAFLTCNPAEPQVLRPDRRRLWPRAPLLAVPRRRELPGRLLAPGCAPITCNIAPSGRFCSRESATAAAARWTAGLAATAESAAATFRGCAAGRRRSTRRRRLPCRHRHRHRRHRHHQRRRQAGSQCR